MFLFLLNSSGAIVLFVYLLIALSQIVLRRKTPPEKLRVKMWFFPVLSILTVAGIVAVLVQMAFDSSARMQFWLSLLSWAVVVALYFVKPNVCCAAPGLIQNTGFSSTETACSKGNLPKTRCAAPVTCVAASSLVMVTGRRC